METEPTTSRAGPTRTPPAADPPSLVEVIDTVKEYAKQETLGPLKGAGRWLAAGAVSAVMVGIGTALLVLALLRMLQNEFAKTFSGPWMSLVPYAIALVTSALVIVLALSRINRKTLNKDS